MGCVQSNTPLKSDTKLLTKSPYTKDKVKSITVLEYKVPTSQSKTNTTTIGDSKATAQYKAPATLSVPVSAPAPVKAPATLSVPIKAPVRAPARVSAPKTYTVSKYSAAATQKRNNATSRDKLSFNISNGSNDGGSFGGGG